MLSCLRRLGKSGKLLKIGTEEGAVFDGWVVLAAVHKVGFGLSPLALC